MRASYLCGFSCESPPRHSSRSAWLHTASQKIAGFSRNDVHEVFPSRAGGSRIMVHSSPTYLVSIWWYFAPLEGKVAPHNAAFMCKCFLVSTIYRASPRLPLVLYVSIPSIYLSMHAVALLAHTPRRPKLLSHCLTLTYVRACVRVGTCPPTTHSPQTRVCHRVLVSPAQWRRHSHPRVTLVLTVLGGFAIAGLPMSAILIGVSR